MQGKGNSQSLKRQERCCVGCYGLYPWVSACAEKGKHVGPRPVAGLQVGEKRASLEVIQEGGRSH